MQIISLIQGLWVALIILMFFVKLRTGICLYVAYMILVPYMNINLGINLQWNMVNVLLLVAFFLSYKKGNKVPLSFKPYTIHNFFTHQYENEHYQCNQNPSD